MRIVAPFGFSSFVVGPNKPTSNQGPWFKDGTQLWVWSDAEADYVPVDISASLELGYRVSETAPVTDGTVLLWFKTVGGMPQTILKLVNGEWMTFAFTALSGPTADRPATPLERFKYYDTDINVEIWWERGQWRTVSGSPGDTKFTMLPSQELAETNNPGWTILGTVNTTYNSSITNWLGRSLVAATSDSDGSNPLTLPAAITDKPSGDLKGEEKHVLVVTELPADMTLAGKQMRGFRANLEGNPGDEAQWLAGMTQSAIDSGYATDPQLDDTGVGGEFKFNIVYGDTAHENRPPQLALFLLVKE